jgi:ferrous iron transport protein B
MAVVFFRVRPELGLPQARGNRYSFYHDFGLGVMYYQITHASPKNSRTARHGSAEELKNLTLRKLGQAEEVFLGQAGRYRQSYARSGGLENWHATLSPVSRPRGPLAPALSTIYNLGNEEDEKSLQLREVMQAERWPDGRPVYTPVVALSIMVFFALCCQCGATLATIKRETGSWGYAVFTFTYMTSLAYLSAFLVYQIGSRMVGA